jgi:hypothetical protein
MTKTELEEVFAFCENESDFINSLACYFGIKNQRQECVLTLLTSISCEFKRTGLSWENERVKDWMLKCKFTSVNDITEKGLETLLIHIQKVPTKDV